MELSAKEQLTKGAWDPEEDQKLIAYIRKHGIKNWSLTPKAAELSRSGKSCRLRWMNYLRPDLKRGRLTMEEIKTIVELHESLGNKWSQIAAQLPGRTDNEIKNFWHTHIRKCFRTVRGANRCKSKRTKREEKSTVAKLVRTSISYGAAQESNSENSSTITESIDEFSIAESYSPREDSCAIIDEINEMQNISSSESHREIHENFCMETFPIFEDLYVPEIDSSSTIFEELGFANQAQEYKPQESTHAPINDELTSFWFSILMEANYI